MSYPRSSKAFSDMMDVVTAGSSISPLYIRWRSSLIEMRSTCSMQVLLAMANGLTTLGEDPSGRNKGFVDIFQILMHHMTQDCGQCEAWYSRLTVNHVADIAVPIYQWCKVREPTLIISSSSAGSGALSG